MQYLYVLCLVVREGEKNKMAIHYFLLYLSKNNDKEEERKKATMKNTTTNIYMDTYTYTNMEKEAQDTRHIRNNNKNE